MAKHKPDYMLLGTIGIILFIGLAALLSASVAQSHKDFGNIYSYFIHQLIFGVGIGLLAAFIAYRIHYKKWRSLALPLLLLSTFFLLLVFVPGLSAEGGGAKRWVSISNFSFQPSELAKLAFVVYLAAWFDARKSVIKRWNESFIPFIIIIAILGILIILQPDIGTLGVIALTSAFIYFVGGASIAQMSAILVLGIATLGILIKTAPYRLDRLSTFLNSSADPLGIGYQINQAMLAIGSGGMLGLGIGKGLTKLNFLPEPMNDSIFAVWSEEAGFVGGVLLITLFIILCFRGFRVAKRAPDRFGRILALGITFWIISQAFINISSMIGLVPLTGIPLPLVSYGGSSMVATLAGLGILLNISKYT
ncbi:MAG: putative lipid II flippase FtsW [Candidatus Spechtbacterales bacterium]